MTTADRIRRAALGPTPEYADEHLAAWIGCDLWHEVAPLVPDAVPPPFLAGLSDTQRRMFLLFVAESLEDQ